jgi:hypothetical protein
MSSIKGTIAVVMFAALLAAVPRDSAATTCTNASLKGVYGVISSGLDGSLQPATGINLVTLDGAGNVTGSATKSLDGSIVTFTFTGTYQLNKNCTGSATWTNQDDDVEHDNIVLNNGNKGGFLIQTDANHVQSSVAVEQGKVTCTNLGVKHTYSADLTGTVISVGQVALGGQFVLNGKGAVTGTATLSLNGAITNDVPVTGTYQINSDCTGTAEITPQGLSAINLAVAVVNAGKEMIAVETDNNTIVSGTLQE